VWRAAEPEDPQEVLDALHAAHQGPADASDAQPAPRTPAEGDDASGAPAPAEARIELRRLPRCAKPAGMAARLAAAVRWPVGTRRLELREVTAEVGPLQAKGSAAVRLPAAPQAGGRPADAPDDAARLETAEVSLRLDRLEHAARLVPAAGPLRLAGGASAELSYAAAAARPWRRVDVSFNACRGRACGQDFRLSGQVRVIGGGREGEDVVVEAVRTDGLELEAGRSHAWIVADVQHPWKRPTGRVHLLAERLDDKELMDWLDAVDSAGVHRGPRPAQDVEMLAARALQDLRRWAARAQIEAKVRIDRLHAWDPAIEMYSDVNHLAGRLAARNGQISVAYRGGLNGGCLRCRMSTVLGDEAPVVVKELALRDAAVDATLQRQLQESFPGNLVAGTLSQHETVRMSLADVIANALDAGHPLAGEGEGTTITTDGVVQGRAAPKFVTAVFPGLNLARYQYKKMTSFTTYRPDGSQASDMIFNGRAYDLYMEGTTSAKNLADYEVGLILLSPPQSPEFNHRFRPGRIPVLNVTGRIEDGQLHDVKVSYPLPNETLFTVFLKNNIFYRLWLEARRP
jgi:hypothetical protein